MTWGIGEGDAVFVPDFTFFSSAETVAYEGATPVFVDVLEDTFNMDPDSQMCIRDSLGIGAVAIKDVPEGEKQFGNPARKVPEFKKK